MLLVFNMPPWPYAAGLVNVSLVMNGVEDSNAGLLQFSINETLMAFEPHSGLVYGSMLLVRGFGFIPLPLYRCKLVSLTNSSEILFSDLVTPYTSTMLECVFHFWPYQAQELTLTLLRGDNSTVMCTSQNPRYWMIEAWLATTMLDHVSSFDGGQNIFIFGAGFHVSGKSTYQ